MRPLWGGVVHDPDVGNLIQAECIAVGDGFVHVSLAAAGFEVTAAVNASSPTLFLLPSIRSLSYASIFCKDTTHRVSLWRIAQGRKLTLVSRSRPLTRIRLFCHICRTPSQAVAHLSISTLGWADHHLHH
jgi:hypothetical protein